MNLASTTGTSSGLCGAMDMALACKQRRWLAVSGKLAHAHSSQTAGNIPKVLKNIYNAAHKNLMMIDKQ